MAKQSTSKGGTSRIRFIMLDAEIPEGDLSQITAAIQNALKPATTIVQSRIPVQHTTATISGNGADIEPSDEQVIEADVDEQPSGPKTARPQRVRKPTTPDVIELNAEEIASLKSFAEKHTAESELDRYLVLAAWFKEHNATPSTTTAHIYTGYRLIGWSVGGIEDFGWPLRSLKRDKLMGSSARGSFEINHLGLDRVNKLRAGG